MGLVDETDGPIVPARAGAGLSAWPTMLPIVLSIAAFGFSVGTWYYAVADHPSLVAVPDGFDVDLNETVLAADTYSGIVTMSVFLLNTGNRAAAILDAQLQLRPGFAQEKKASDIQCLAGDTEASGRASANRFVPAAASVRNVILFGGRLDPAAPIIDPGKIVDLGLTFSVHFAWDEMHFNRSVEACVRVRVLDNRGNIVNRVFPAAMIRFYAPDDKSSSPGYDPVRGASKLL